MDIHSKKWIYILKEMDIHSKKWIYNKRKWMYIKRNGYILATLNNARRGLKKYFID